MTAGPTGRGRTKDAPGPPRLAEFLLSILLPAASREEQLGDVAEGFARRSDDPGRATRWYWGQLIRSVIPALRLRARGMFGGATESGGMLGALFQDLRHGARSLLKAPSFSVTAIVTLAVAIGVNTAVFSLVSVIVFADFPMQDADEVALIHTVNPSQNVELGNLSIPDYIDLVEGSRAFGGLTALSQTQWVMTGVDAPEDVAGVRITSGLAEIWQLPPVIGRTFAPEEGEVGGPKVAMLTDSFWKNRFGSRPDVLGESINLDGAAHTIVGVMDPRFAFASFDQAEVLVPLVLNPDLRDREARGLFVTGRVAPGATHEQGHAEVMQLGQRLAADFPDTHTGWQIHSGPVRTQMVGSQDRMALLIIQIAILFVILIACTNVANMLFARATTRAKEMAVRSALGAGRGRLIRQLLTESFILSVVAGVLGLGISRVIHLGLRQVSQGTNEVIRAAEINGAALLFTLGLCVLACFAFGLLPALRAASTSAGGVLRDGRGSTAAQGTARLRSGLVTAQVSLAFTLMIVAGLLSRAAINHQVRDSGFDVDGLVVFGLNLSVPRYPDPETRARFFEEAQVEINAIPGVESVEMVSAIPKLYQGTRRALRIEANPVPEGLTVPSAYTVTASPGYFASTGIPLLRGRGFGPADGPDSERVAILSEELVRRHWPGVDPIGARIQMGPPSDDWVTVVGVVGDIASPDDREPISPALYVPYRQNPRIGMWMTARSGSELGSIIGPVRQAVWGIDPEIPIEKIQTVTDAQLEQEAGRHAIILLLVTFAVFALFIAAIGIYGVMAYSVELRRREIGLRMALGAGRSTVRRMLLSQGGWLLARGLLIGLAMGFLASRLLGPLTVGVSPTDPLIFIGVPLVLALAGILANALPALRATRMDPANALRAD